MNPRIVNMEYLRNHQFLLFFSNGEQKLFDLKPYLHYPIYHALQDEAFCSKAILFNGTLKWDDEIDFDPDTIYLESFPTHKIKINH